MRSTAQISAVTATVAAGCLLFPGLADAVPGPNGVQEVVTAVGASTTYEVTGAIFAAANASAANTDPDTYVNLPPDPAPGGPFDPGDGSGDVVRSDLPRSPSDPAAFQYYGFAKDAVSWAASSTGAGAGVTLTLAQLRGIYDGTVTNWNQVGGANAPITVYLPPAGSGTSVIFAKAVLGFDPAAKPVAVHRFREHDATTIPAADRPTAIAPYSVAQWAEQGNGVVSDKRAGFLAGTLIGAGSDASPVAGTPQNYVPAYGEGFLGAHSVYYVVDTRLPSHDAAVNAIGFDQTGPSPLCAGSYASILAQYSFKPLPASPAGITCTLS
ncbi:PstS family phosphate ABC transporter substrate-binding protein [Amycolatopsis sp. WGS_07]|uniref:PstS family phosphate ABC transporter substrate-binding protein n=1 Tax=Amycolatopsis sp. WGS_07 TaxID=3076764 RepID=UPI003873098D